MIPVLFHALCHVTFLYWGIKYPGLENLSSDSRLAAVLSALRRGAGFVSGRLKWPMQMKREENVQVVHLKWLIVANREF